MRRITFRAALGSWPAAAVLVAVGVLAAITFIQVADDPGRGGHEVGSMPADPATDLQQVPSRAGSLRFSPVSRSLSVATAKPLETQPAGAGIGNPPPPETPLVPAASAEIETGVQAGPVAAPPAVPAIVNQFDFRIEPSFRDQLGAVMARSRSARIQFPVSDQRTVDLAIVRHDPRDGNGVVYARVDGRPHADAVLAYVDDAVAGSIVTPEGELFEIRYVGGGVHRVLQLDPHLIPNEGESLIPPSSVHAPVGDALGAMADNDAPDGDDIIQTWAPGPDMMADTPMVTADAADIYVRDGTNVVVDMVIVYTPESRANNGGVSGMNALIDATIARSNLAHSNSQTGVLLRVVHTAEVAYTSGGSISADLSALQHPSDGRMDEVYTLRTQYNADLVSLFVPVGNDGVAGIAYLNSPDSMGANVYTWAFSTVVDIYANGNLTFAHEVGHNMGAMHAATEGGSGAYSYSYGWRFMAGGTQYRTVMAYAPGLRIPYFSNPDVTYLGVPTGTATANNALTMWRTRAGMAVSRIGTADWTVSADGDLNADSKPDLVWRNMLTGRAIAWLMDNATRTSTSTIWAATNPGESAWVPMVNVDLNADTKPDMVWRNTTTGRVIVWYMDGVTRTTNAVLWAPTTTTDAAWMPMTAGDFNADNKPDLVWRNTVTGRVIVWFMDGITRTSTATLWSPTTAAETVWVPLVAGDFNADNKPDLVFRNSSTGRVIFWYMDGTTRTSTFALWPATNPGEAAWRPMAAGDFDADGQLDLVWRNTDTGRTIIWYMTGSTRVSTALIWS